MRSIIEGEAFANAKFRICPYAEDLDEYLEGTFELLARDPEQGMDIGVPSHRAIRLTGWPARRCKPCTIVYQIDPHNITLVAVEVED